MSIVYILLALLMLGIMVMVHEWGHFIAARMTGIPVQEYAIGFGPKLIQWHSRKHETVFTLRLIPAGGYCAFYGEDDPDDKADEDPRAMRGFPVWKRLVTVAMGPVMNFVLAFVVALMFFWIGGVTQVEYDENGYRWIDTVNAGSAADQAGFETGDILKAVNGVDAAGWTEDGSEPRLRALINEFGQGGAAVSVLVQRGDQELTLTVTPVADASGQLLIGIGTLPAITSQQVIHPNFFQAAGMAAQQCVYEGGLIIESLRMLVQGEAGVSDLSGPVGVVRLVAEETRQRGPEAYIMLLIFISVNLGLVNLLPIPGLDGAQIILLLVEGIRRKPLSRKTETTIKLIGFAALILLFVTLTYQDVAGIVRGTR